MMSSTDSLACSGDAIKWALCNVIAAEMFGELLIPLLSEKSGREPLIRLRHRDDHFNEPYAHELSTRE